MSSSDPWYVSAFGADYRKVYPHRDLASARVEVAWVLATAFPKSRGRLLDLCCGFGRHSVAFAAAGVDVFGLDLSAALLSEAATLPGAERIVGRLVRADSRRLPYSGASFEAVANLFSSFGYFGDEGDLEALEEIARVLEPGGRALLDLMNPERIRNTLVPESTTERGGARLLERRRLADEGRRVQKSVHLRMPGGAESEWLEDVRMYETDELVVLAERCGLALIEVHGDFKGARFGPEAERQIVVFERKRQ